MYRVHSGIRALMAGAFAAYCRSYNTSLGCFELGSIPPGTTLGDALATRYALSVQENVIFMLLDNVDQKLDLRAREGIAARFGAHMAKLAVGLAESRGAPTRADMEIAAQRLRGSSI